MKVNNYHLLPLTPKQAAILVFLKEYCEDKEFSPSLEEISKKFKVSIPTIHQHIEAIRKKGFLQKGDFQRRSMVPIEKIHGIVQVPLLGKIAAGLPIQAFQEVDPVQVPTSLISNPENHYALKVSGDSMIGDDIWDGDIILVKHQINADIGELIVAVANDEVTLKRYGGVKNGKVVLIPKNPKYKVMNIEPDRFEIRGKFVGLLRRG